METLVRYLYGRFGVEPAQWWIVFGVLLAIPAYVLSRGAAGR